MRLKVGSISYVEELHVELHVELHAKLHDNISVTTIHYESNESATNNVRTTLRTFFARSGKHVIIYIWDMDTVE